MRLGKSLVGNPVFGGADGRRLGEVKDIYLDDDLRSVVGIYLGREGLLRPTPLFVDSSDIALFGIDALLARRTFTVREGDEAPEPPGWLRLNDLRGRSVRTPGGTKIGRVEDVTLDEEARVTGVSLTNLSVKGPVADADAVARSAVVEVDDGDGVMTIDLAKAEQALLEVDPDLLFSKPAAAVPETVEEPEAVEEPWTAGEAQAPQEPEAPEEPEDAEASEPVQWHARREEEEEDTAE
jgi:sporulation protein YlmC with PRC-barrel domain